MSIWKGIFLILGIKSLKAYYLASSEIPALAIRVILFPFCLPFIPFILLFSSCYTRVPSTVCTLSTLSSVSVTFSSSNHIVVRHIVSYVSHRSGMSSNHVAAML